MYSTGVPTSLVSLLQSISTIAATVGWTIDQSAAAGAGGVDWIVQMHNGSGAYIQLYAHMASGANQFQIECNGGTAIASSSTLTNQSPSCTVGVGSAGSYTGYHLFSKTSASPYLHLLLEIQSNLYADLFVGTLNAVGGASPAVYVGASSWPYGGSLQSFWDTGVNNATELPFHNASAQTRIGVTVDGTLRWFGGWEGAVSPSRSFMPLSGDRGSQFDSLACSPNTYNGLAALFTSPVFVERAAGNVFSYVGDIPDLRFVNIANITPKDEQTIGSDTWKIFPLIQKSTILNTPGAPASSGMYGVALLKSA
jgi:hypothetical protein